MDPMIESQVTVKPPVLWTEGQKTGFRFLFIFFILFILINNNRTFPFWDWVMTYPTEWLHVFIPWVGKHILHLSYDITVFTNWSGDTTYDYVVVLVIFVTSIIVTVIWSALDRRRTNYETLFYWLMVAVRFYVGMMLIFYGLIKIIKIQFPRPELYRLTEFYGDSSPMGLAWAFLGFSKGYNLFIGIAEAAGILLLFRRTMIFGALISLATTANIMAINYFYDVPVKILSTALFVMSLFLVLTRGKQLLQFFFTDRLVSLPVIKAPVIKNRKLRFGMIGFKLLLIGYAMVDGVIQVRNSAKEFGDYAPKAELYGLYDVESFVVGRDTLPPLTTDSARWRQMIIPWNSLARVRFMNDSSRNYRFNIDSASQVMNFSGIRSDTTKFNFRYERPSSEYFSLAGMLGKDSVFIYFRRYTDVEEKFLLNRRGFHWIQEYPFNR